MNYNLKKVALTIFKRQKGSFRQCVLSYLIQFWFFKNVFTYYVVYILYVRSFFLVDRSPVIRVIWFLLFLLNSWDPALMPLFSLTTFCLALGVNLMVYDQIASQISSYILEDPSGAWLRSSVILVWSNSPNVIKRHFGVKALGALIVGKTTMTSTGRATLTVGAFTGSAWFLNSYLDRRAAARLADQVRTAAAAEANAQRQYAAAEAHAQRQQATADMNQATANMERAALLASIEADNQRQHASAEAAKQRAFDQYRADHVAWSNRRFHKGKEPNYENYKNKDVFK